MSVVQIHQLAGVLILLFAALLLSKEARWMSGTWPGYLLPVGTIFLGLFLILDPIIFHGGGFGSEGLQHQIQGAILVAAGVVEVFRLRGRFSHRAFGALMPLSIVAVGLFFVLHSQHEGGDMAVQLVQHRILGVTIIAAGIVKAADNFKLARGNWGAVGWLLMLVLAAIELLLYVEAGGAAHGRH